MYAWSMLARAGGGGNTEENAYSREDSVRILQPSRAMGILTYPCSGDFSRPFLLCLNTSQVSGDAYTINGLKPIVTAPPQVFIPSRVNGDSYLPL
jgi:hypothetical protein